MQCISCGEPVEPEHKFCEACGHPLSSDASSQPAPPVSRPAQPQTPTLFVDRCRCGAGPESRDPEGYCSVCGLRFEVAVRPRNPRDHKVIVITEAFAAVTDIGRRHHTNQDDVRVCPVPAAAGPGAILVVCDGLSSSCAAEAASETASETVMQSLLASVGTGKNTRELLLDAISQAQNAVCAIPIPENPRGEPPATTVVAAVVLGRLATVAWVGDSRAYLIGPDGGQCRLVTHDHSWVNEMVDSGAMLEADALLAPEAHAITQCLGPFDDGDDPDGSQAPVPSVLEVEIPQGSSLLLCSDGFWNFLAGPEQIAAFLQSADSGTDACSAANRMVDFANSKGGRDNITAAIYRPD